MGHKDESREPTPKRRRDANNVEEILEEALSQLNNGASIERVLARYPAHADELRPMLQVAVAMRRVPLRVPNAAAKQAGLDRLLAAVEAQRVLHTDSAPSEALADALDEALARLRAGEELDAVLARYPAYAAQMRPLLRVAAVVQQTPPPIPNEKSYFAGRARLVKLAAQRRRQQQAASQPAAEPIASRLAGFLTGLAGFSPTLRRAAITVVLLIAMIFGGFSVTQVAADSLPTSPLYPVKRFTERVRLVLTPSQEEKAKLHLRFSQRRLQEAEELAQAGTTDADLLNEMLQENDRFLGSIKDISPEQRQDLLANGAQVFHEQYRALVDLSGANSPLRPEQRALLRGFAGAAGTDREIAEEVQGEPGLADYIRTPTPEPATATAQPSPTPAPTEVQVVVEPTAVPATATPVPPSPTATPEPEMVQEPAGPGSQALTATVVQTAVPATATPGFVASTPVPPDEPTETPTLAPTATPAPTEAAPTATATSVGEIGAPTLAPVETPSPATPTP